MAGTGPATGRKAVITARMQHPSAVQSAHSSGFPKIAVASGSTTRSQIQPAVVRFAALSAPHWHTLAPARNLLENP